MNLTNVTDVRFIKTQKKEKLATSQRYNEILNRNRQINRVNIFILIIGLMLNFTKYQEIGNIIVLIGIGIFTYTTSTILIIWWKKRK